MKILHAIEGIAAASGGTTSAFFNLIDAAATRPELDVAACCPDPGPDDPSAARVASGPSDRFDLTGPPGRLRPGPFGVRLAERARDVDVLHLHGMWSVDLVHAALEAHAAGVATVWQPHGMLIASARRNNRLKKDLFMRLGLARALRQASAIVCATDDEASDCVLPSGAEGVPRVAVPLPVHVPSASDLPALRAEGTARLDAHGEAPRVVFLGRLHPVKRVELTIEALAHCPGVRLIAYGPGQDEYVASLREHAARVGVADRVAFAGWLDPDDRWSVLAAADALVINSVHENFGYVIAEAAACGTPVAMTDNLSLAVDARAHGFAHPCAPEPRALGEVIGQAAASRESLGPAGRAWVEENLSFAAVGSRLEAVYALAIAKNPPEVAAAEADR